MAHCNHVAKPMEVHAMTEYVMTYADQYGQHEVKGYKPWTPERVTAHLHRFLVGAGRLAQDDRDEFWRTFPKGLPIIESWESRQ